jgi:hypothetical protein
MQIDEIRSEILKIVEDFEEEGEFGENCIRVKFGLGNFSPSATWPLEAETTRELRKSGLSCIALFRNGDLPLGGNCLELLCYNQGYEPLSDAELCKVNVESHRSIACWDESGYSDSVLRLSSGAIAREMTPRMLDRLLQSWFIDVWNFWLVLSRND